MKGGKRSKLGTNKKGGVAFRTPSRFKAGKSQKKTSVFNTMHRVGNRSS